MRKQLKNLKNPPKSGISPSQKVRFTVFYRQIPVNCEKATVHPPPEQPAGSTVRDSNSQLTRAAGRRPRRARVHYRPQDVIAVIDGRAGEERFDAFREKVSAGNSPQVYVCFDGVCKQPVTELSAFREAMAQRPRQ